MQVSDDDDTLNVSIVLELDGIILDTTLDIMEMLIEAVSYLQEQGASETDCLAALALTLEALLEGHDSHTIH